MHQHRLNSLENTRREAAERAILLDQKLRDISAERRYVSPPPPYFASVELAER
jgi:hypothetical protein